jgi:Na+/H+ antiporter NhaD/arsenite permease-like protein
VHVPGTSAGRWVSGCVNGVYSHSCIATVNGRRRGEGPAGLIPRIISHQRKYFSTYFAVIVLALVFVLIAVRQVGRFDLRIWQIMLGGALAVLVTGQITPADAIRSINIDVMIFLFGMFVVGEALVQSGYLACIAHRIFSGAKDAGQVVLLILFGLGILAAFLMNDTLAVIGTPLVIALAARSRISKSLLLLALAFAITTGSVMSPIGNPQNLLVAVDSGMSSPFVTFGMYLFIPTLISLGAAFLILRIAWPGEFSAPGEITRPLPPACDSRRALPAKFSLAIIFVLSAANVIASFAGSKILITLPLIAICAAAPVMIFSGQRFSVLRNVDWPTLVFFAAMFVLMESVWETGFFQSFIDPGSVSSVPVILGTAIVVSQFISNVPFVALFQPMILQAGGTTAQLMALAAGSTLAGNLTILGAASNVIIIQNAEKEGHTLTFMEFAKVGIPLTIIQVVIYWIWLTIVL